ncbi:MAG: ATP-binding cassette domain-containing protein [Lachnospiraceae bacterium]|nr:ATP-binding cassette domain-containing protein [Lachnospiraceae bacterium]
MRYIKEVLKKNRIMLSVYIGPGIFNAFMANYKADYFQKVITIFVLLVAMLDIGVLFYAWSDKSLTVGSVVALIALIENAYMPIAVFNVLYVQYKLDKASYARFEEFLCVRKGEKVAFVGESGSGKSTLVKILLGLLKYQAGQIYLDSMELKDICLDELYSRISYLSQDTPVFDETIRENIVFEKNVSEGRILEALSKVQLSYLIENLAEGLDTEIGEKGTCLSGGEKQRLALSRLWFEDSELIILDEATSAMDNLTEENVMNEVIQRLNEKTVIAIAHRLNSISGQLHPLIFHQAFHLGHLLSIF